MSRKPPRSIRHLLQHPILSAEDERALLVRIAGGDGKARDELVLHNGRFVASVVAKFQGYGVDFEDLWQEGMIGLLDTLDRWDMDRPIRFTTYAWWWIRNRVQRYAQQHCSDIRWPFKAQRMKAKLGRGEDVPAVWRERVEGAATVCASVDQPVHPDSTRTMGEATPGPDAVGWLEAVLDFETLLAEDCLDERDRFVLSERCADRTLESIGKELGLTRERVRQLEDEALQRLRERVEAVQHDEPIAPKRRPVGLPCEQLLLPLFAEVAA